MHVQSLLLRTLPSDRQTLRQRRCRDSRLGRSRRDAACVERRATIICQLTARVRKDRTRRDRRGANKICTLHGAQTLAGFQSEATPRYGRCEGSASAADVPCAAADDAPVCFSTRGDLEGSFAGERSSRRRSGAGTVRGGGRGGDGG